MLKTQSQWLIGGIILDAGVFLNSGGGDRRHALLRVRRRNGIATSNGNGARKRQSGEDRATSIWDAIHCPSLIKPLSLRYYPRPRRQNPNGGKLRYNRRIVANLPQIHQFAEFCPFSVELGTQSTRVSSSTV